MTLGSLILSSLAFGGVVMLFVRLFTDVSDTDARQRIDDLEARMEALESRVD